MPLLAPNPLNPVNPRLITFMSLDLEIKQLKETIFSLREELERAKFEEGDHIQAAVAAANEELRQLRTSIVELRDQLELREGQHKESLRQIVLQHDRETDELRRTITTLRDKLQEVNEAFEKIRK
jgi:chromosome segregation ATPase